MYRSVLVVAASALAVATISSANAADMAVKTARAIAPAQAQTQWTGWNVGGSIGGRSLVADGETLSFGGGPPPFPALAQQSYDSATFRGGGYLGYDWQFAPQWLVGIEGDFAWGNATEHVDALQGVTPPKTNPGNFSEFKQTWDAGIRGRLGYLINPTWLVYMTGGVTWQHFEATVNCAINTCGPPPLAPPNGAPYLQTNSTTRAGWTLGGGIETMLWDRWLLRGEYRYADFGTWTTNFGGAPAIVKQFDLATHTGLLGVAKKF